jgi:hypothetical protein
MHSLHSSCMWFIFNLQGKKIQTGFIQYVQYKISTKGSFTVKIFTSDSSLRCMNVNPHLPWCHTVNQLYLKLHSAGTNTSPTKIYPICVIMWYTIFTDKLWWHGHIGTVPGPIQFPFLLLYQTKKILMYQCHLVLVQAVYVCCGFKRWGGEKHHGGGGNLATAWDQNG